MDTIKVLITSAGSAPAIGVIKALRQQKEIKIRIIAVDMDRLSAGFYLADDFYLVPSSQESNFISEIIKICKKEKVSFLIPIIDEELPFFAKEQKLLESVGLRVLVNNLEVIERGNDKYATYLFCREHNILAPETYLFSPRSKYSGISLPIIVKPRWGRGSQFLYKLKDLNQLDYLSLPNREFVVQEFISGREYTVDILAQPDGTILQAIPRERIVVKAGMMYKGRTEKNKGLIEYAKRIAQKFGINGPCNIQFIEKGDKFYLIEVNPKFAAGLPLTVNAGINIPFLLIKMHLGMRVSSQELEFKDNFYMLRYWEEIYFSNYKKVEH
ncbi:MAG: hypothetical protein DRP68_02235 [Candidatus Omnitrophota bacterium]|nr:MAG: hypothetical protein DRP68_02235 [Candidatus Omnitrophota bacterium]